YHCLSKSCPLINVCVFLSKVISYDRNAPPGCLWLRLPVELGTMMNAFNAAVADFFNQPSVLKIDASEWHGAVGDKIYVQAVDDTLITKVHMTISDQNGVVLEEGNAQRADGPWWTYTANTQVPMEPKPHVVALPMTCQAIPLSWHGKTRLS